MEEKWKAQLPRERDSKEFDMKNDMDESKRENIGVGGSDQHKKEEKRQTGEQQDNSDSLPCTSTATAADNLSCNKKLPLAKASSLSSQSASSSIFELLLSNQALQNRYNVLNAERMKTLLMQKETIANLLRQLEELNLPEGNVQTTSPLSSSSSEDEDITVMHATTSAAKEGERANVEIYEESKLEKENVLNDQGSIDSEIVNLARRLRQEMVMLTSME